MESTHDAEAITGTQFWFKKWHLIITLRKCDKILRKHCADLKEKKMQIFSEELDKHVRRGEMAEAWRVCPTGILRGSQSAHYKPPPSHPTKQQLLDVYSRPPQEGGWGGC